MGKYLIKGALALFAGALVLSCADTEAEYVPVAQQKIKAFEDVFKEVYGDIDPYQDWGFEQGKTNAEEMPVVDVVDLRGDVAFTRTGAFGRYGALLAFNGDTRTANPNKNLWGDPLEYNMKIPPALTQGQKLRVKAYFQHHPNITYTAPDCGDYYIQQVYKGYDDYETYLRPNNDCSLEYYYAADHTEQNPHVVIGSDHMDKLTIGNDEQHVLNFNYGSYDYGKYHEVLNEGESSHDYINEYTHVEGKTHPDQITLMQNICPTCVGFHDSEGDVQHNDHAALVAASVIDQWATEHEAELRASGEFGENCVTFGWDRSFVGLDYESKLPESVTLGSNATVNDCCPNKDFVWDGTRYWKWEDIKDQPLTTPDGRTFPLLSTDKNQYLGTYVKIDQNDMVSKAKAGPIKRDTGLEKIYDDSNDDREVDVLDLTKIFDALGSGKVAAVNNDKGGFVKNLGGRDYVFSDWIVTLTAASYNPPPTDVYYEHYENTWYVVDKGRVFCEDLGRTAREDLDYNDIVFDVRVFKNFKYHTETYAKYDKDPSENPDAKLLWSQTNTLTEPTTTFYQNIKLLAAGGTIPVSLIVGDPNDPENLKEYIIHDQFNSPASTPTEMMVNTCDNNSAVHGTFGTRNPVELGDIHENFRVYYNDDPSDYEDFDVKLIQVPESLKSISSIRLWSSFDGGRDVAELQSVKGGAPQKFMAPYGTTKWAAERNNISLAYPGNGTIPSFNDWVLDRNNEPWGYANTNYCYSEESPYNPEGRNLPMAFRCYSTVMTDREQQLWPANAADGNQSYGSSWNLANLDLTLDVDHFSAGDRLRFYAKDVPIPEGEGDDAKFTSEEQKAWITVVVGNITPYFIHTEFPYYEIRDGQRVFKTSGCIEVIIDQSAADLINNYIDTHSNKLTLQVQGRNFTLTRICRVKK